jgi:hypothetical protein
VLLEWATAVELDHYGFHLLRSNSGNLNDAEEIAFVPAAGYGQAGGAVYQFRDENLHPQTVYTYWLIDVNTSGQRTTHTRVSAATLARQSLPHQIYLPVVLR